MSRNILIQIGNSDDKLSQAEWSRFIKQLRNVLIVARARLHGEWFSAADSPWQNANWCIDATSVDRKFLRETLIRLAQNFRQDSIAWTEGEVEFLSTN